MKDGEETSRSRDERGRCCDGPEGRPGSGEIAYAGQTEGDRPQCSESPVERSGQDCVYVIETQDGAFVKIGYSFPSSAPI
jgi:hypothetical protein